MLGNSECGLPDDPSNEASAKLEASAKSGFRIRTPLPNQHRFAGERLKNFRDAVPNNGSDFFRVGEQAIVVVQFHLSRFCEVQKGFQNRSLIARSIDQRYQPLTQRIG